MICCTLPLEAIPLQYQFRAHEARKIFSIDDRPVQEIASCIAVSELTQVLFFSLQTALYALAYARIMPPLWVGVISLALIPIEAASAYNTLVHQKPCSRLLMTVAAIFMLTFCASFACAGVIADSAITLCMGGILLHVSRNVSEYVDSRKSRQNPLYLKEVLNID